MVRIAIVDRELCQPGKCSKECIKICPVNRMGEDCIVINEEIIKARISEPLCTGCALCIKACPFGAINIVNTPEALSDPLFQYGENMFRLFRMPYPKKGVVGIIGSNGVGKSTALKILSGELKPNMGRVGENVDWKEVIKEFKGQELQSFFERLSDKKLKVSYKPQDVDLLPKAVTGKVSDLLSKVDDRGVVKEYVKYFDLENLWDSKLSDLSGGELQRVAVIAASARDAEVYTFDEPTSFLDIKQRLKLAKFLRDLVSEGRNVILIEHDLAVLDYLSDYIHILYGEPAAFGIVSHSKSVNVGINQFLEGYIPDENMRFRDYEITFDVLEATETTGKKTKLIDYPALKKSYDRFSLESEAGDLYKAEVLGVMGPNGIGKTTFVKMLAGVLKPDSGKVDWSLKVSYKPQYIKTDYTGTVRDLIFETDLDEGVFRREVEQPLQIPKLYDRFVNTLSGGELQRVSVALALGRDADIYLLDEPSAFLDVVQRLDVAKAIKRVIVEKEAVGLVVDHDLVFQDYVSDRLLIFDGDPGKKGFVKAPTDLRSGMNSFLKDMGITFRRGERGRPRANKLDSQLDVMQKRSGEYFYAKHR